MFNVTQCLDTSEHNHSIGDIVDGNFVSFSNSDLYCINNPDNDDKPEEKNDEILVNISDIQEMDNKDKEILDSLCENCRSSFCSNVSSTLTLTPSEENGCRSEESVQNVSSLSFDNVSNCGSIITVETMDGNDVPDQPATDKSQTSENVAPNSEEQSTAAAGSFEAAETQLEVEINTYATNECVKF